jgi:hypothetical protein
MPEWDLADIQQWLVYVANDPEVTPGELNIARRAVAVATAGRSPIGDD